VSNFTNGHPEELDTVPDNRPPDNLANAVTESVGAALRGRPVIRKQGYRWNGRPRRAAPTVVLNWFLKPRPRCARDQSGARPPHSKEALNTTGAKAQRKRKEG